jgi:hypothetical protein
MAIATVMISILSQRDPGKISLERSHHRLRPFSFSLSLIPRSVAQRHLVLVVVSCALVRRESGANSFRVPFTPRHGCIFGARHQHEGNVRPRLKRSNPLIREVTVRIAKANKKKSKIRKRLRSSQKRTNPKIHRRHQTLWQTGNEKRRR